MSQILATFNKTIKEFLREKPVLFWTIAWPIIWVIISSFSFAGGAPDNLVPYIRGTITVSMTVFALTLAGMANLPGNIAQDREQGLLAKLQSMPVSPWKDFVGRILGLAAFSCIAAIMVVITGITCGAHLLATVASIPQCIGFLITIFLASSGIGLIIGTTIKRVQGAVMTGVGISVITSSISGLFAPYSLLPPLLQKFSRIYPISSANSAIVYLLLGEDYAGYNPLNVAQIAITLISSFLVFAIGLFLYTKLCWGKK